MLDPQKQIAEHLGFVADAILALTGDEMLTREQFRMCVRTALRNLAEAERWAGASDQSRVHLAATNLNTAVAAYRASWAST